MSAAQPQGPGLAGANAAGGAAGKPGDPSMEDILASIRRILSEDEGKAAPDPAAAGSAAMGAGSEDVLMLDASMIVAEPPPPEPPAPAPAPEPPLVAPMQAVPAEAHYLEATPLDSVASETVTPTVMMPPAPVPPPPPIAPPAAAMSPAPGLPRAQDSLVAPEAAAAAASSVGALLKHLQAERQAAVYRGGPTIEDIVREEMRPLLKSWLDANLPPLVERLVRAEIERVVARSVS
jgi:cell pole-organizing protein PopZ